MATNTSGGGVRQRKATEKPPANEVEELTSSETESQPPAEKTKIKRTTKELVKTEDSYSPFVDVFRVLTFLVLASIGLSYIITGGDSFFWGMRHPPKYLRVNWWKEQFKAPTDLTLAELAQFDGSDPSKPIYLAINGTIYDVSANQRTYGQGGSYNVFAGTDASRGFVTGCFRDDRTADMRGVELMFIPRDDPEVDNRFPTADLAALKERELAEAKQKVHDQLAHWVNFFAKSPKYPRVGRVVREEGWLDKEPHRELCAQAEKGRPKRKAPGDS
ncbi:hypothetical protein BX600DRAFT_493459 [Xylariales sp. PMI_506]|nr:hypothetical protein BX600DRAFT_493459 [Xylariales sp. PMI_506]